MNIMFIEKRDNDARIKALKVIFVMVICSMMIIPIIQHIQEPNSAVADKTYTYHNEMVKFVGSNIFIGFNGNLFPVSWNVFELNPNYSPGPVASPFISPSNGADTKNSPMIEETFNHYSSKRVVSLYQDSAVMIRWNHYVRIAEIFSFYNDGIDASVVMKNLNETGSYIGTFSLGMGKNSTISTNGFYPSYQNISSGTGIIPSNDWNVSVGNIAINWQSEDSIFHSGAVSVSQSGDQIILPFDSGTLSHNESYTIDPMIYYNSYRTIGPIGPIGPGLRSDVTFKESGLPSGTPWKVTLDGISQSTTSNSITFSEASGEYTYTIGSVDHYSVSPSSGTVSVSGTSQAIAVSYTQNSMYAVTFTESGLSSGTNWTVNLNGNTKYSTLNAISFSEYGGSYSYSIGSIPGFTVSPSNGMVNVNGGANTVSITYTENLNDIPKIGYLFVNYTLYGQPKNTPNLTRQINTCTENGAITYTNTMLEGGLSNITFQIPYQNADLGDGTLHTYAISGNQTQTTSPYYQTGPTGGNPNIFDGMRVFTLTSSGNIASLIYCNQNIKGNGVASFSWITQPGVYGGFCVELVNSIGIAYKQYNHNFDVYSRLENGIINSNPCISDSLSQNSVFTSEGVYIGTLGVTASNGPVKSNLTYCSKIPLGLSSFFISPENNANTQKYNYGILDYEQYLNWTGNQYGIASASNPRFTPICSSDQNYENTSVNSNSCVLNAEKAIYEVVESGLFLSTDPIGWSVALAMVALGPFLFQSPISTSGSTYWGKTIGSGSIHGLRYGSWNQTGTGSNTPSPQGLGETTTVYGICDSYDALAYPIVNNGHGMPSLMQDLQVVIQQPQILNVASSNQHALNYYTYTESATIVPIAHDILMRFSHSSSIYFGPGVECFPTSTEIYTNTSLENSYTVATSLQLYMPIQG